MILELEYAFGKNHESLGSCALRSRRYHSSASPGFDHQAAGWPWLKHVSSLFQEYSERMGPGQSWLVSGERRGAGLDKGVAKEVLTRRGSLC